jgi:hypothetical protein
VNYDNTRERAYGYLTKYGLDEIKVVDDVTGKSYGVQKKADKKAK